MDNASHDGSPDIVSGLAPHAHLIALPGNVGFARANNIGIREGTGRFVLLLNSDTVTSPGQIDVMLETLNPSEQAAVLGPRLIGRDGRPELSFGPMVSPWNEVRQKALGRLYEERVPLAETLVHYLVSRPRRVDWVSGACLLVRRADAEAVGLLDEQYFMYAEDVDFCAALRARGRQILFSPAAEIMHVRGASRRAAPECRCCWRGRSRHCPAGR